MLEFTQWLQATGFFTYLRGSSYTYPVILSLHMVMIAFFGGMLLITDLRILGIGFRNYSVSEIVQKTRTAKMHGLILMLVLGFLLFGCKAEEYYYNAFFKMKLALLILVLLNWLIFRGVYNNAAELDRTPTPGKAKLAAALSLLLWIGIACSGRGIGYIEPPLEKLHAKAAPGISAGPGESLLVALHRSAR